MLMMALCELYMIASAAAAAASGATTVSFVFL
jgi:hypothetical protein